MVQAHVSATACRCPKLLKKRTAHPDKSFTAAVRRADDWIKAQISAASGFFRLEDDNAPVPLHTFI